MKAEKILERLCSAPGVSGAEAPACREAIALLERYTDSVSADSFGCVTAHIGQSGEKPTVMLEAHIDEIGFIVTYIDENGFLKVGECGGTDRRLYPAQTVSVLTKTGTVKGVVTVLPPHVAKDSDKAAKLSDISIDIGFPSRELAQRHVSPGDRVIIDTPLTAFKSSSRFTGRAIDNRAGAAAVLYALELTKDEELPCNVEVLLASQEEVGSRGAAISAYNSAADIAVAVDVSFAYTPDDKKEDCAEMGKGPMIGISPVLDAELSEKLKNTAKEKNIPFQTEIMGGRTGTDADVISLSRGGIRTALVSIPIKYMHTPVEIADIGDIAGTGELIAEFLKGTFKKSFEKRK